jgi:hypothetical protein
MNPVRDYRMAKVSNGMNVGMELLRRLPGGRQGCPPSLKLRRTISRPVLRSLQGEGGSLRRK